jgi:ribonuclease Z
MARLIHKRVSGIKIVGFSLAGEETVIVAPELNVCFDFGRAPREMVSIDNVCLTHGHMDHAAGIAYYFSQRGFIGNAPGRVIVHKSLVDPIRRLMEVWEEIEGHESPGYIEGVEHLQEVEIRRGLLARPFSVNHSPDCLGFSLIEVRHKLKAEFEGKTGPQLVALKGEGVEIERRVEVPLLTYTGDTAVGRFLELDFVRNSRLLIIECTFFEKEHVHRARAGRHLHVDDLPVVLEAVPEAQIMLIHLTRRTDIRYAKRVLQRVVPAKDVERISFLMDRPPRREGPRQPDEAPSATEEPGATEPLVPRNREETPQKHLESP